MCTTPYGTTIDGEITYATQVTIGEIRAYGAHMLGTFIATTAQGVTLDYDGEVVGAASDTAYGAYLASVVDGTFSYDGTDATGWLVDPPPMPVDVTLQSVGLGPSLQIAAVQGEVRRERR